MPGVISYLNIIEARLKDTSLEVFHSILIILTSSSIFIAISGCFKTYFSFLLYRTQISPSLILASFLVIYSVYSLNKLTDAKEDLSNIPERTFFVSKNKNILKISSASSYILAIILAFSNGWEVLFIILFPIIAGIIYSIRISPSIPRMKDIFAVKSIVVALSWSLGSTFLPIIHQNVHSLTIIILFYFFFAKSFINTVLFDVMDIKGDKINNVQTIPVVIGTSKTKKLLLVLNTTLILFLFFSWDFVFIKKFIILFILCIMYGYWYILYFFKNKNRLKLEILVDGEWILILIISLLITIYSPI